MCVIVPHYLLLARFISITLFSVISVIIKLTHHHQVGSSSSSWLIIIKSTHHQAVFIKPTHHHQDVLIKPSSSSRPHQVVLIKPSSQSRPHQVVLITLTHGLVRTAWWERLGEDGLMGTSWWWWAGLVRTAWWERLDDDESAWWWWVDLMMMSQLDDDEPAWWWWVDLMMWLIHTNMISIKITTFLALMWIQIQKLIHINLIFLGWVQLLKTHRIIQPGLGYDELSWVQLTSFRRVATLLSMNVIDVYDHVFKDRLLHNLRKKDISN
jgi:hypothetical protein